MKVFKKIIVFKLKKTKTNIYFENEQQANVTIINENK